MFRNATGGRAAADGSAVDAMDPLGDLLCRAGRGDQDAFVELYDTLAPLLHGIVLRIVRDPAQSEEVTQEALVELWRLAPRYEASRGSVRSWSTTLAHRRAIDRVRSEQSARDRTERDAQRRDLPPNDVAEQVVAAMDATRVRKALGRLTDMQRQAVELAYFGGHSYRQVALLLDVPEGTIKNRIRDGMIRLRDELGVAT
jgi:RNA polymerase sigma-70 factor, ECF subfamily